MNILNAQIILMLTVGTKIHSQKHRTINGSVRYLFEITHSTGDV